MNKENIGYYKTDDYDLEFKQEAERRARKLNKRMFRIMKTIVACAWIIFILLIIIMLIGNFRSDSGKMKILFPLLFPIVSIGGTAIAIAIISWKKEF